MMIKFWVHNEKAESFELLTMVEGQQISIPRPAPEGQFSMDEYEFKGGYVVKTLTDWGVDESGYFEDITKLSCPLDKLHAVPFDWNGETLYRPDWALSAVSI